MGEGSNPFRTAGALIRAYAAGETTPAAELEMALDRLDRFEPTLNAFMVVARDSARMAADSATARWRAGTPMGPLDGVPLTIKDITDVAGWPTRKGSALTPETPAEADSPAVARLRAAGAVLFGKTTTPEFGWKGMTDGPLFGTTCNPWDTTRTPGGSSGGAAAALAAGIGAAAHGTDAGGSLRIPGSYCGLVGFKPSFGRVPDLPHDSPFDSLATAGAITRDVADAALLLDILAGTDRRDWRTLPREAADFKAFPGPDGLKGMKIAYAPGLGGAEPVEAVTQLTDAAVERLADLGAEVSHVGPVFAPLEPRFRDLWLAGFGRIIDAIPSERRDELDPRFRAVAEAGLDIDLRAFYRGYAEQAALAAELAALHERYALLVTPTMPTLPPTADTPYASPVFDRWRHATPYTVPFNLTGQPALSMPCGVSHEGLPVGLQIAGPRFAETTILAAASALEAALALPSPHPVLRAALDRIG
ncbi:amidase [Oceanibacterium hippocampi]|uniref:Acylamidase n=1 Tax=Oceanibacterium hippocampi TaxID=745714 RepID=A0A1Y5S5C6_9PROT|nr:amidase [Oceanibacterium hippocampi]SLN32060.1 Acylamidase [Oceanibacterium hippocampi]